ncbi:MAG: hypothetical protein EPO21_18975 [Chloroflexota bacterium]|nr:MAG: hypothetical protein EPO21_18975 [Chloroflexota bacterium]
MKQIIFNVWGLELEKISLTELVQNRQIKKYLVDAETALGKGNLVDAVEYASAGLQVAMNHAGEAIVWHKPRFTGQHYDDEYLEDTLDRMKDVLSLAVLGLNYGDFMRYKRIVGAVFVRSDGSFQHPDMKEEITARDAEFVVTYCIDTVVQIENAVGNLDVLAEPDGRGA